MPSQPRVIWTGVVPSTSGRRSKRTGQRLEYRVTLFEDGEAQCSCPAALFGDGGACKHVQMAREAQGKPAPAPAPERFAPEEPAKGGAVVGGTPGQDDFLDAFADDPFADLPQVRHERRD